jgi:hypothetical protein
MTPNFAFEIVELALGILKNQTAGKVQQDAALAGALLQIIQKAVQAYEDQTGQPLDPTLIQAENPV